MPRTSTYPLYDRLLDGRLASILAELRSSGMSVPEIRDRLRDEHRIDVSVATVRRWLDDTAEAAS